MSKSKDDLLKRPLYIYDLTPAVLSSITVKDDPTIQAALPEEDAVTTPANLPSVPSTSQSCSLCSQSFTDIREHKAHLKSDQHNYNLKQKLRGLPAVSEAEFEKLVDTLDESLSGSDDSESEEEGKKETTLSALLKKQASLSGHAALSNDDEGEVVRKPKQASPLIWLSSPLLPENHYFGVYHTLFSPKDLPTPSALPGLLSRKQLAPIAPPKPSKDGAPITSHPGPHIFMCMIGGGHFAAMVVSLSPRLSKNGTTGPLNKEAVILAHRTFHRYTTRRKQGGSQSANDNAKGAAHSAGSTLRRYNEQALVEDVRGLLAEWKGLLDTAELLFVRATGMTNRRTLFGPYEGQVLRADDPRVRGFPFNTRRATQNELMRAFIELTRVKVREILPQATPEVSTPPPTKTTEPKKKVEPEFTEEEETQIMHSQQIQALIKRSKLPALLTYFQRNNLSADFQFFPPSTHHHAPTPLHFAASIGAAPIVTGLLVKANANPTLRNTAGHAAYALSGTSRPTRDAFRVARHELGEKKWAWDEAGVPSGISAAEVAERAEKESKLAEEEEQKRRKAEEERLARETPKVVARGKTKAGVLGGDEGITAEERREREGRGLSAEMRMKLERERRARAAEARMKAMRGG